LSKKPPGRKIPGYSVNSKGEKVPDETIKDLIKVIIAGDGFPYGYKKINITLQEDYQLIINHKKTYRLCKERLDPLSLENIHLKHYLYLKLLCFRAAALDMGPLVSMFHRASQGQLQLTLCGPLPKAG